MNIADDLINQSVSEVSDSMRPINSEERNCWKPARLGKVTLYQDMCQEANFFKPLGAVDN
jgi:hypothetical protein